MEGKRKILFALLAALLAVSLSGAAWAGSAGVQIMDKSGVGSYLADSQGMTLYLFKRDSPGKSVCTGRCAQSWPAFSYKPGDVTFGQGLSRSDFGFIVREDGKPQLTYKGMPLYLFVRDRKSGDVNGQGLLDAWFAAKP